jgi:hypothetical protein
MNEFRGWLNVCSLVAAVLLLTGCGLVRPIPYYDPRGGWGRAEGFTGTAAGMPADHCAGFSPDACARMKAVIDTHVRPAYCAGEYYGSNGGFTAEQQRRICYAIVPLTAPLGAAPSPAPPPASLKAPSVFPPPSAPVPATNQAYWDGFNDSQAWTQWFRSLAGAARIGAMQGAYRSSTLPASLCADKSLAAACHVAPCVMPGETQDPLWIAGCREAQRRLIPKNERQAIDPEYKRGWEAEGAIFMEQYRRRVGQTAFADCVKAKARIGSYASDDGGRPSNG